MTTDKAPYFYAGYALVWGVLVLYAVWIGMRVRAIEERLSKPRRSDPPLS